MAEKLPERWQDKVARDAHGYVEMTAVTDAEAAQEHLLMNLRLAEGLDLAAYRARWGRAPNAARIAALEQQGFLHRRGDRLAATAQGRLVLNSLIAELADQDPET